MISHLKIALLLACLCAFDYRQQECEAARIRNRMKSFTTSASPAFFFIQVADPQLGMKNLAADKNVALKFDKELKNLQEAATTIKNLRPKFVMVSGDMQNFWSGDIWNNLALSGVTLSDIGESEKQLLKEFKLDKKPVEDYGNVQAAAVMKEMQAVEQANIDVYYTPGNHDLMDIPTMEVIDRYRNLWGPDRYKFWVGDVMFVSINSQLYHNDDEYAAKEIGVSEHAKVVEYRDELDRFIDRCVLEAKRKQPKAMVVLTHIPPFIGSTDEDHGWANWDSTFRSKILQKFHEGQTYKPDLWLCGHFHGNVNTRQTIHGGKVEVVTTGSVGSTMLWNYTEDTEEDWNYADAVSWNKKYDPGHASKIAAQDTGNDAFMTHIQAGDWGLVPKRITTDQDLSGVRVVQFYDNGQYRHKWFSLNEFKVLSSIDDESMTGAYTSPNWSS